MKNKNKYITRTFITKTVTAMCINPDTAEIFEATVTVPNKSFKTEKKLEEYVQSFVPNGKVVKINSIEDKEELRAMLVSDFIKYSQPWTDEDDTETTEE